MPRKWCAQLARAGHGLLWFALLGATAASCSEEPAGSVAGAGAGAVAARDAGAPSGGSQAGLDGLAAGLGGSRDNVTAESGSAGLAEDGSEGGSAGEGSATPPQLLSSTGLYADLAQSEELGAEVMEYRPRFELWSDGAEKRRFLRLPPGAQIDSSDMDFWRFPPGTRAWKEFWRDGVRIETRLLEKLSDDSWLAMAYAWNEQQTEATAANRGRPNAQGTDHDIPSQVMCGECHNNVPDRLLGVSALQLAHALPGVTLAQLASEGRLSHPPQAPLELPGDTATQAALGYLHANCGNCHNERSGIYSTVQLRLWLEVASLASVEVTSAYQSAVNVALQGVRPAPDAPDLRISPGNPEGSAIFFRMADRDPLVQMPPLASQLVDENGLALVEAWIAALSPP